MKIGKDTTIEIGLVLSILGSAGFMGSQYGKINEHETKLVNAKTVLEKQADILSDIRTELGYIRGIMELDRPKKAKSR